MSDKEIENNDLQDESLGELAQYDSEDGLDDDVFSFELAGLNLRALAFFIDLIIISLIALAAFGAGVYLLPDSSADGLGLGRVFMPIFLLLFFLGSSYFVVLSGYGGKTIGKMIMGIRIISSEGNEIGYWDSFVRWIGYYVSGSFLFIGFLWSVFDRNSQSWHDKIASTYVVKD